MGLPDVLSIQLYSLRSLGDVDLMLDTAASAGFSHVELLGTHLDDAEKIQRKLEARGLKASSAHVSLEQLRDRPDAMQDAAIMLAITALFMPAVPAEDRDMAAAGWRDLGLELGRLSEAFLSNGLKLGYHNHDWELAPKEGAATALELLFEAAGTSPLAWQADVAWLARGGAEPTAWLERYRDRLQSAHVKDIARDGEGREEDGWADVGYGVLDWQTLWKVCRAQGARWMVVEHDKPADPVRFAARSYTYLASMTA